MDYQQRLQQLTEDNAFINVNDVLKDEVSGSLHSSGKNDIAPFIDDGRYHWKKTWKSKDVNFRCNITAALLEQHKGYLSRVEEQSQDTFGTKIKQGSKSNENVDDYRLAERLHEGELSSAYLSAENDAPEVELGNEQKLLECWKYLMLNGDKPLPISSSSFFRSIVQHCTHCPSFEAMTATPINRSKKSFSELLVKKKKLFVSRGFVRNGPIHHSLCSVCRLPAQYRCARCRKSMFCSIECHTTHDTTRCLKHIV